jgi:hypothetical protein
MSSSGGPFSSCAIDGKIARQLMKEGEAADRFMPTLREVRDADAPELAPNYATTSAWAVIVKKEIEFLGDSKRAGDVESRAHLRKIAYGTAYRATIKLDRSSLQHPVTKGSAMLVHKDLRQYQWRPRYCALKCSELGPFKRNANASFMAPCDLTRTLSLLHLQHQHKSLWDIELRVYLKSGPSCRQVMDGDDFAASLK